MKLNKIISIILIILLLGFTFTGCSHVDTIQEEPDVFENLSDEEIIEESIGTLPETDDVEIGELI